MTLPALSAVQDAYTAIDKLWEDAEAQNRPANVAEANQALQLLAQAIGITEEPDGKEGDPLISLALAVAGTLRDALAGGLHSEDPASEYERILRSAEQEAVRNPEAGRALARIADRWLSEEFAAARKRTHAKTAAKTAAPADGIPAAIGALRMLGLDDAGVLHYLDAAGRLAVVGASPEQIGAACRIIAAGSITVADGDALLGKAGS